MRTLYLLRHAKSSWRDESLGDFDRPLKKRGRNSAKLVGEVIAEEKPRGLLVISSPAVRTRETIKIVLKSAGIKPEVRFESTIYEADLNSLLAVLGKIEADKKTVMLVGHNPGMEMLVRFLTDELRAMPTAALAKIKLNTDSWNTLPGGEGSLEWLNVPKDVYD